ncbi:MAG: hypothetical protein WA364_24335 [Candidatus Nitrosopolaris sp.]
MSQISTNQTTTESSNKWAGIAEHVIDKVIGKNMPMTSAQH